MALSINMDGSFIATICEDESKKYLIEVYDFDFSNPYASTSGTLYSHTTNYEKQCISWNPKRNILAFGGEEKDNGGYSGNLNLLILNNPSAASEMQSVVTIVNR